MVSCSSLYFSNAGPSWDTRFGVSIVRALISVSQSCQLLQRVLCCFVAIKRRREIPEITSASFNAVSVSSSQARVRWTYLSRRSALNKGRDCFKLRRSHRSCDIQAMAKETTIGPGAWAANTGTMMWRTRAQMIKRNGAGTPRNVASVSEH